MANEPIPHTSEAPTTRPAPEGSLAPAAARGNGRPARPEELRSEIEETRLRMSRTLDAIEDRLVEEKREIWAKLTLAGFRRRISTEPWRSVAIAFVAGYVVAAIRD